MAQATFDEVLEAIEHLPVDEQADLLEVVRRRLAERGRSRVIEEIAEARTQFSNGTAKPASVDEIMRGIES
jgi:predicted house-cleaning noncanonical NTP pyrophosphatase (MazG superfamily)